LDFLPSWLLCHSVGARWSTCGCSPRSLGGVRALLQGFLTARCRCARCLFQPASTIFQPASTVPCVRTGICLHSGTSRRCSLASSPQVWAHSRRSGRALWLVCAPLRRPFAERRGEVSTTPIERVANNGSIIELLTGGSSGRPCHV
jgi:hypothetical protein